MPFPRRPSVPSAVLLLGLAACSGAPPQDAPDEPKPDVDPAPAPNVDEEPIPIGALYGAPPDLLEDELQEPIDPDPEDGKTPKKPEKKSETGKKKDAAAE